LLKARTSLALVVISLGTLAATVSCGSDETTGGGGVLLAGGSGGASGGAAGKGGAVGRGGAASGGAGTATGALGGPCASDLDCGDGLKCFAADDAALPSGGPSQGLCTATCKADSECEALTPGAACVDFGDAALCLEGCAEGTPTDISTKCHDRPDVACVGYTVNGMANAAFLCTPTCRADAECGTGLFCDQKSGLCTKTKPTGDPPGTPCDPAAKTNNCFGACLTITPMGVTPAKGVCAQLCAYGSACMYSGTKPGGICAGALSDNEGVHDLGYCEARCDCTGDCNIPGDVCRAWTAAEATIQSALGSDGYCYPVATGSTELTCGEGGAGGIGNTPSGAAGAAGAAGGN